MDSGLLPTDTGSRANPRWDWVVCKYQLRHEIEGKSTIWNMKPTIVLSHPSQGHGEGDYPDPLVRLYIDTEKSLQFSPEIGWNWHKSWNIPNISVRLDITSKTNASEHFLCPKNLYAKIFAVKGVLDNGENFFLQDVKLRGQTIHELVDGHCFFSSLKFLTTSYNNEGVKFHLLLSIYIKNDLNEHPKILSSVISQPIFVDSRKTARDNIQLFVFSLIQEKRISSIIEPFLPEALDKILIKRESKCKEKEAEIVNSVDGLFNYLTAPNIRHKIKHPVFLLIKFSSCVALYYNTEHLNFESLEQLIETLQSTINDDSREENSDDDSSEMRELAFKSFILLVKDDFENPRAKKILEAIDHLNTKSMGVVFSEREIPTSFAIALKEKPLIEAYKNIYVKLFTDSKIPQPHSYKDEDSSSEIMELPKKKVKPNEEGRAMEEFPISSAHELQKLTGNKTLAPIRIAAMNGLQDDISNSPSQENQNGEFINHGENKPRDFQEAQRENFTERLNKAQINGAQIQYQNMISQQPDMSMLDPQKQLLMKLLQGQSQMPNSMQSQVPFNLMQSQFPQMNSVQMPQVPSDQKKGRQQPGAAQFPNFMGNESMMMGNNSKSLYKDAFGSLNSGMNPGMNNLYSQMNIMQQYQNLLNQHYMTTMMLQQMMRQDPKNMAQTLPNNMQANLPNSMQSQMQNMRMQMPFQMPNMQNMPNLPNMPNMPNMNQMPNNQQPQSNQNMMFQAQMGFQPPNSNMQGNMQFPFGMNFPNNMRKDNNGE